MILYFNIYIKQINNKIIWNHKTLNVIIVINSINPKNG